MQAKNAWWMVIVGGLVGAMLVAGTAGAAGAPPPFPGATGPPFPGGLPQCQASLNTCTTNLNSCTASLAQEQTLLNSCTASLAQEQTLLNACTTDLTGCLAEPHAVFPGDGVDGPALRYHDNGDGTVTDNNTLLMWEQKVAGSGCLHCVNDGYTFAAATSTASGSFLNSSIR